MYATIFYGKYEKSKTTLQWKQCKLDKNMYHEVLKQCFGDYYGMYIANTDINVGRLLNKIINTMENLVNSVMVFNQKCDANDHWIITAILHKLEIHSTWMPEKTPSETNQIIISKKTKKTKKLRKTQRRLLWKCWDQNRRFSLRGKPYLEVDQCLMADRWILVKLW